MQMAAIFAAVAVGVPMGSIQAAEVTHGALPAIRVNEGGHYLETEVGRPFFWLGDTAWRLIHGTTREEASYYLRTRAAQGFTIIQTIVLGEPADDYGEGNKTGPFVDGDPSKPNDAFFDRMVEVVDEAAQRGLYVALVPCWGDKLTAPWGRGPRLFRLDNLPVARAYGRFIAARLKGRSNLLWMLGGDTPAKLDPGKPDEWPQNRAGEAGFPADYDWRPIWREMAAGIEEGFGRKPLFLFHPVGATSTSPTLHQEAWLSINGMQSGHSEHDVPVWDWIARDFALTPPKPTLDLEPNYEDHPVNPWPTWNPANGYFRDYDVRKQCYRSVFAGACGVTYGHNAVWAFIGDHNNAIANHADRDWIDGMHRPGGEQMHYLRELMESRPFFTRIPDPALVRESCEMPALHVVATRDREGTYAFIYVPESSESIRVDLGRLHGTELLGWWFDPRTGFAHPLGTFPGGEEKTFTPPPYGPDWVLVVDAADAHYAPPGVAADAGRKPLVR